MTSKSVKDMEVSNTSVTVPVTPLESKRMSHEAASVVSTQLRSALVAFKFNNETLIGFAQRIGMRVNE